MQPDSHQAWRVSRNDFNLTQIIKTTTSKKTHYEKPDVNKNQNVEKEQGDKKNDSAQAHTNAPRMQETRH